MWLISLCRLSVLDLSLIVAGCWLKYLFSRGRLSRICVLLIIRMCGSGGITDVKVVVVLIWLQEQSFIAVVRGYW